MNRFDRPSLRSGKSVSWLILLLFFAHLANAASWVPFGPGATFGDSLRSIIVQPGSPGTVWLGMSHGGLYRSQNRGTSWTWVGRPFGAPPPHGNPGIGAIDADPSLPGRLFAATREGAYRTDDGGTHWAKVSAPGFSLLLGNGEPESLSLAPGALYLATYSRLLVSEDAGRHFEVRFEEEDGVRFATDSLRSGLVYLVCGNSHLQRSTDAGKNWSEIGALPISANAYVRNVAAVGGSIYLQGSGDDPALWRSRDGGATWKRLIDGDFGSLAIHPTKPRTLYWSRVRPGSSEILVSRDGGETWEVLGTSPVHTSRLAIDPSSGTLYGLDEYALGRSSDGKTWEILFKPPLLEWAEVSRLSFRPNRPKHQALTVGGRFYRSFDGGASWSWRDVPQRPLIGDVALDGDDPNRLIAVTVGSSAGALLSLDGGRTWRGTSSDLENGEGLIRSDRNTLFAIGCGIARTTDNGASWQKVLRCHPTDDEEDLKKRWTAKLDVDPLRPDRVYALSFQAELDSLPHGPLNGWPSFLWRSEDGGTTWRRISSNVDAFALERGTGRLYALRGSKLLMSDDAGRTWQAVGTSPGGLDLIADPATPGALYAIGYTALKWSPDRGTTWRTVSPGGGWVLQFDPANPKTIFTGTNFGIFRQSLP